MKVKLTATKYAQLLKVQDVVHNLMMLTDEDSRNTSEVNGIEVNKQDFHDMMSCISASIEQVVEAYDDFF